MGRMWRARIWFSMLIGAPIAWLLRLRGIWCMPLGYETRIGHMIAETFAATVMQNVEPTKFKVIWSVATPESSANPEVLRRLRGAWKPIPRGVPTAVGRLLAWHPISRLPTDDWVSAIGKPATLFRYSESISAAKLIESRSQDAHDLLELKRVLGIPATAPYVTLQVRERGYSLHDDDMHDYRNADLTTYFSTVDWLVGKGYTVVRVGGANGTRWPSQAGLIDYSHSQFVTPLGDLLLIGGCQFMIGNTSGLHFLATAQGVPVVGVNMAPMSAFGIMGSNCLSIPKMYVDETTGRLMNFQDSLSTRPGFIRSSGEFAMAGVALRDCLEEEILEVVSEMHQRLSGKWRESPIDSSLQERFRQCLNEFSYSQFSTTRIGAEFLRRYEYLLP